MKAGRRTIAGCAAALVLAVAATAIAYPRNGSFETGTLKGWDTFERGDGNWEVYDSGGPSLPRGLGFPPPPDGEYAAIVNQGGPGVNILHRKLKLRDGATDVLSFQLAWRNYADRFYTPRHFRFGGGAPLRGGGEPNQQFRIDLMKPGAGIRSLARKDVVATLFRARRGTPLQRGYRKLRFNLDKLGAEGRVRLRIAEVDNQEVLNVGIDAVKVKRKR